MDRLELLEKMRTIRGPSELVTLEDLSLALVLCGVVRQEAAAASRRKCPACGDVKPGWPDSWRNVAEGRGLTYACADCAGKAGRT